MATKNRGLAWSVAETQLLIDLWSENNILNVLDGTTRNAAVYNKFSKQLENQGFHRTTAQIRDRMKRLKRDYKEVIDNNKAGAGRKTCHFFYELDRIFGTGSFSNSMVGHDNASSLPVNVCEAELGKCVPSDEEDDIQHVYSYRQNSPNGMVFVNGPRRVSEERTLRPTTRRRFRREIRTVENVDKETVSVEGGGVEVGDVVRLEVEKLLLEMEKLREEISRVREERGKIALEKEVLMLQRQRLLREEDLEEIKTRQAEARKSEQSACLSREMGDPSGFHSNNMNVNWRREATNSNVENGDPVYSRDNLEVWEGNCRSGSRGLNSLSGVESSSNLDKRLIVQRDKQEVDKGFMRNIQDLNKKETSNNSLLDKVKVVSEIVEDRSRASCSVNNSKSLTMANVESMAWEGEFCGFLNDCQQCGHTISCSGPLQPKKV